jgi:hypothetical protein
MNSDVISSFIKEEKTEHMGLPDEQNNPDSWELSAEGGNSHCERLEDFES